MQLSRFARFAWAVLAYNLLVILWGAFVRATGSGAGCGSHWPLCNGQVIPRGAAVATLIEFSHRLTSGVALLLVLAMLAWAALRHTGAPSPAWRLWRWPGVVLRALRTRPWSLELVGAAFAMLFMLTEAAVGAGLVLLELVADDDSMARAVWLGMHLVNTFILVAFIALTAWWASGGAAVRLRGSGVLGPLLLGGIVGTLLLGVTGAITALGDTLFPAASLAAGVRDDFSPAAHLLLRLRIIHPALAVTLGLYLVLVAFAVRARRPDATSQRLSRLLVVLFLTQIAAGVLNLVLLAPVWMQLLHLLLADGVWLTLVLLAAAALADHRAADRRPSGAGLRAMGDAAVPVRAR